MELLYKIHDLGYHYQTKDGMIYFIGTKEAFNKLKEKEAK